MNQVEGPRSHVIYMTLMWDPSQSIFANRIVNYPLPISLGAQHLTLPCPSSVNPCLKCHYPGPQPSYYPGENYSSYLREREREAQRVVAREGRDEGREQRTEARRNNTPNECHSRSGVKLTQDNHCALCKSNRETEEVFLGHALRDQEGKVSCPVLRSLVCRICGGTGDDAHTLKYCPQNTTRKSNDADCQYPKRRNAVGRLHSQKF